MKTSLPFAALVGLSMAIGAQANLSRAPSLREPGAMARTAPEAAPAPSPVALDGWWNGFQDDTLGTLVLAARHAATSTAAGTGQPTLAADTPALPLEMKVAAAYVSIKTDSIGLDLIDEATAAAQRERSWVEAGPAGDADRGVIAVRLADAARAGTALRTRRDASLDMLAALCGMTAATLGDVMAPALAERRLPQFNAPLPQRQVADWLMQRQDVALAGALRDVTLPAHRQASDENFSVVVERAQQDIADAVDALEEQRASTAALYTRADEVRAAFDEAVARQRDGQASEREVLERYQQFLLYSQQFTSASGTLALGWIRLLCQLQGALDVQLPAPSRSPLANLL